MLLAVAAWLFSGQPSVPRSGFAPPGETTALTLLFTSDIHGYALPEQVRRGMLGGFEALDGEVRAIREQSEGPVFLLDGGDILTGQPTSLLSRDGLRGAYLVDAMNLVGYDAMALGNHELDYQLQTAIQLRERSQFPWLAANLLPGETMQPSFELAPSLVIERQNVRVGVIGLTADRLNELVGFKLKDSFAIADAAAVTRREVEKMAASTDLIVVLSHRTEDENRALAEAVDGIDVIVCGHSHRRIMPPHTVNGALLVQAGHNLTAVGKLELRLLDGAVIGHDGALISLWADDAQGSLEISELMAEAASQLDKEMSQVLGALEAALTRNYYSESALGNYAAQAMRRAADADVGLINSGGLRCDLPQGPITRSDVFKLMPFDNHLVRLELSGAELLEICRHNAWSAAVKDHGILQVSGLHYEWARAESGDIEILSLRVGDDPVDPEARYSVASNDFIVLSQPNKYLGFAPERGEYYQDSVREVLLESFSADSTTVWVQDGSIAQLELQPQD